MDLASRRRSRPGPRGGLRGIRVSPNSDSRGGSSSSRGFAANPLARTLQSLGRARCADPLPQIGATAPAASRRRGRRSRPPTRGPWPGGARRSGRTGPRCAAPPRSAAAAPRCHRARPPGALASVASHGSARQSSTTSKQRPHRPLGQPRVAARDRSRSPRPSAAMISRPGNGNSTFAQTPSAPAGRGPEPGRQPLGQPALDPAGRHRDHVRRERVLQRRRAACRPARRRGDRRVRLGGCAALFGELGAFRVVWVISGPSATLGVDADGCFRHLPAARAGSPARR